MSELTLEEYEAINPETIVKFRGQDLRYWTPTGYTLNRAMCLFEKGGMYERETIRWIHSMDEGDLLVDIGANVGTYSVFAAANKLEVIAIEPESSNYSALDRNIKINDFDKTSNDKFGWPARASKSIIVIRYLMNNLPDQPDCQNHCLWLDI